MSWSLGGRASVVTGASRGIGRAIAIELARAGAHVGLLGRDEAALRDTEEEIRSAGGQGITAAADLLDGAAVANAIQRVVAAYGPIEVLVNNAAQLGPLGPTFTVDFDAFASAVGVNFVAPVRLALMVIPGMRERGAGRVVNVSSPVVNRARDGEPENCYISSKAALEAHTLGLATELADTGVTVNLFYPGGVDTQMASTIRALDPAVVGERFVRRNIERFERGEFLEPEIPARLLRELLESDRNGETISTWDEIKRGS